MLFPRLKRIFDFYLYSNFHISLCAVALLKTTCGILHLLCPIPLVLIAFFGTLSLYCFHRLIGVNKIEGKKIQTERNQWNVRNKKLLMVLIGISVIPLAYAFFNITLYSKLVLIGAGVMSLFYSSPVFKIGTKSLRLRDFPLVKIFFIGIVWMGVTVFLPVMEAYDWYQNAGTIHLHAALYWSVVVFLFIIGLAIPFDVRDVELDDSSIRSLPMVIGEKQSVRLAQLLLVISSIVFYVGMEQTVFAIGLYNVLYYFLWAALAIWVLHDCSRKKGEYYFSFVVDGLIIALWAILTFERYIH